MPRFTPTNAISRDAPGPAPQHVLTPLRPAHDEISLKGDLPSLLGEFPFARSPDKMMARSGREDVHVSLRLWRNFTNIHRRHYYPDDVRVRAVGQVIHPHGMFSVRKGLIEHCVVRDCQDPPLIGADRRLG